MVRRASRALPSVLAVQGRADRCLILCGTNLTQTMLDAAVRSPELESQLTGAYQARIGYENDRQFVEFKLELKTGIDESDFLDRHVYQVLVREISRLQPEFLDDWRNMYQLWDSDPQRRILRLSFHPWPALSKSVESQPKQQGIQV